VSERRIANIVSVATALPPHRIPQEEARKFAARIFGRAHEDIQRRLSIFENARIRSRYLCVPKEWFESEKSFSEKNETYIQWACRLGEEAAGKCLSSAGVRPNEVDLLLFVSTTGLATPSIDARLINLLGMSPHTRRSPIWGLGCAGGAAGLSQAYHHILGNPKAKVLVVAVELCGLTFLHGDLSLSNLTATALFADGAAAVLVAGPETGLGGVEILSTRSTLWPDSYEVMGWNLQSEGLQVVFAKSIPDIIRRLLRPDVEAFLDSQGLTLSEISHFIPHPGGAKVMDAYQEVFHLPPEGLRHATGVLRDFGNMSSPTVLFVLERALKEKNGSSSKSYGLLTAVGPGFSAENLLLRI
jgi:alkylresorcinol/alkylpyrone synthase